MGRGPVRVAHAAHRYCACGTHKNSYARGYFFVLEPRRKKQMLRKKPLLANLMLIRRLERLYFMIQLSTYR